jgi:hypothetical protein
MKKPNAPSPYKFLDAYTREDAAFFFGREQEVEEAYTKVFQSRILLVYGASGTGKSSLIHCGLADKFKNSDWLPISIRRGGDISRSLKGQLQRMLAYPETAEGSTNSSATEIRNLVQQVFLDHFKPIYFIFDQFEELFIFGDNDEWRAFAHTLQTLLKSELDLHFIFVVRGDYLEYLNEFEKHIPGFFDNRLRVEKMSPHQAERSIMGPAEKAGIKIEAGFAESLLQRLSGRSKTVEPTFLQVYLDRLYREEQARNEGNNLQFSKAGLDQMGPIDDILAEFVDEQVYKMESPKLAWDILKCFVSLEGTKIPLRKEEVRQALNQLGSACSEEALNRNLEELVSKRILKSADEEGRLELRHDSLALKIYERISLQEKERLEVQRFLSLSFKEFQKRGTLLKEEDLAYVLPHQRKLDLSPEIQSFVQQSQKRSRSARRKARNQRIILLLILLLALSSLVGWYYTGQEKERANQAALIAQEASVKAQAEKARAEREKQKAEIQEAEALKQAQLASAARIRAEQESAKALAAEQQALREQNLARAAETKAYESAEEALRQKGIAEKARAEEERLRKLGLARQLALRAQQMEYPARAQLALQAYKIHIDEGGSKREPALYSALLSAYRGAQDQAFLQGIIPFKISAWQLLNQELYFRDEDEKVYQWEAPLAKESASATLTWPSKHLLRKASSQELFSVEQNQLKVKTNSEEKILISRNGSDFRELALQARQMTCLKLSADGKWLAWGQEDGKVFLYQIANQSLRQMASHFSAVTDLQFDPSSSQFASSGYDRMVQVWTLDNLSQSPLRITELAYWVAALQFEGGEHLWINTFEGHLYRMPLSSDRLFELLCDENLSAPSQREWQQWTDGQVELLKACQP